MSLILSNFGSVGGGGGGYQDALIDPMQADRYYKLQPDKCCPSRQLASKGSEVDNNCQLACFNASARVG